MAFFAGHDGDMRTATVAALRDQLSEYLRLVEAGESIRVMRRSKVIAELHPVRPETPEEAERQALKQLEREGVVTLGKGRMPVPDFPFSGSEETGLIEAVLAEREEGW